MDIASPYRSYALSQKNMIERNSRQIPESIRLTATAKNNLQTDLGVAGNQVEDRNTVGRWFIDDYREFQHGSD